LIWGHLDEENQIAVVNPSTGTGRSITSRIR